ncbi:MAG: DMT family transporter [Pseudonocardiaceae bacterium]
MSQRAVAKADPASVKNKQRGRSAVLLIVATTLWGASSVVLGKLGPAHGAGAPLLAAGGAVTVLIVVLAGPARSQLRRIASVPRYPTSLLVIGLLEALNLGLYAAALAWGPVPVVVALHLMSPLLLMALAVIRRQRRLDSVVMLQVLLVISGIILFGMQPAEQPGSKPLVAGVLAVGSAVALTALISAVAKLAPTTNPDIAAAAQLTIAAVATTPMILVAAPLDQFDAMVLLGAGAFFLGPAFAIYWRSLRGLNATTAGMLGLNEVVSATLFSATLFGEQISFVVGLSGVLMLTAVVLEFHRSKPGKNASTARSGNKLE